MNKHIELFDKIDSLNQEFISFWIDVCNIDIIIIHNSQKVKITQTSILQCLIHKYGVFLVF